MSEPIQRDVLLEGFIEVSSAIQFGEPCIVGTRVPYYVGLGWVWEMLDKPERPFTREQVIALAAFHAGVEWQRSRKRRKAMAEAVGEQWARNA